jgi:hypothetical protein
MSYSELKECRLASLAPTALAINKMAKQLNMKQRQFILTGNALA